MLSSYQLVEGGGNGYNGTDDWQYLEGLGHLDDCNGHLAPTPEAPDGVYHYHTTFHNGAGGIGFPYFLLCYHGLIDETNLNNLVAGGAQMPPPN